jgi:hypothetical protein
MDAPMQSAPLDKDVRSDELLNLLREALVLEQEVGTTLELAHERSQNAETRHDLRGVIEQVHSRCDRLHAIVRRMGGNPLRAVPTLRQRAEYIRSIESSPDQAATAQLENALALRVLARWRWQALSLVLPHVEDLEIREELIKLLRSTRSEQAGQLRWLRELLAQSACERLLHPASQCQAA